MFSSTIVRMALGFLETADNLISVRCIPWHQCHLPISFHMSKKKKRKHTTGLCGAQSDILQEPTRRLARTVGSSTGLERWCPHMRRQLRQQCHRCCIHIHALLSPPAHGWSLFRESGALDALTGPNSCWGCSLSYVPTEHQKPMRCRFDLAPGCCSVDTYLTAGLDASFFMAASWPHDGMDLAWGIRPVDCREDGTLRQTVSFGHAPATLSTKRSSTDFDCGLL